jgi:hypothetical protein
VKTISFYAVALRPDGRIGQILVTRAMAAPGVLAQPERREWTGVTYESNRAAERDMIRLNCGGVR